MRCWRCRWSSRALPGSIAVRAFGATSAVWAGGRRFAAPRIRRPSSWCSRIPRRSLGIFDGGGRHHAPLIVTGDGRWDGVASLVIAAILAGVAALLARESKALLIGERADPQLERRHHAHRGQHAGVCSANSIVTVQLAPHNVIATLSLDFFDTCARRTSNAAVVELESRIRSAHPEVSALFVKPQSVLAAAESAASRHHRHDAGSPRRRMAPSACG